MWTVQEAKSKLSAGLATRNTSDFRLLDLQLADPWS